MFPPGDWRHSMPYNNMCYGFRPRLNMRPPLLPHPPFPPASLYPPAVTRTATTPAGSPRPSMISTPSSPPVVSSDRAPTPIPMPPHGQEQQVMIMTSTGLHAAIPYPPQLNVPPPHPCNIGPIPSPCMGHMNFRPQGPHCPPYLMYPGLNYPEFYYPPNLPAYEMPVNFGTCKARFSGIGDVRPFVVAIVGFKDWYDMSDEVALQSFSLVLLDLALIWWNSIKDTVTTWTQALNLLKIAYRCHVEPYKVFRALFSSPQKDEPTVMFLRKSKSLLSQLPAHALSEPIEVDILYSLLNRRVRHKINRDDCQTFADLLRFAIEFDEGEPGVKITEIFSPDTPSSPVTPTVSLEAVGFDVVPSDPNIVDLNSAHTSGEKSSGSECQDLKAREKSSSKKKCVHCGALNSLHSCPECSPPAPSIQPTLRGCRPLINITIFGEDFDFVVDTGARNCIATDKLSGHLLDNNQKFTYDDVELPVAYGFIHRILRIISVDVWVDGVAVPTSFIELPQGKSNILGIDFIMNAGLVLDFSGKGIWLLRGGSIQYPLMYELRTSDVKIRNWKNKKEIKEATTKEPNNNDTVEANKNTSSEDEA